MRQILVVFIMIFGFGMVSVLSSVYAEDPIRPHAELRYVVKVHEFEGCECNPVCPCVFSSDTTFGDCRGITVFTFNGSYGSTMLKDVSCVLVFTWAGKNSGS